MSRDFALEEAASSFTELLDSCFEDMTAEGFADETSESDRLFRLSFMQGRRFFLKAAQKKQKAVKSIHKEESAPSSSCDSLSSEHSVFCDLAQVLFSVSGGDSLTDKNALYRMYAQMMSDGSLFDFLDDAAAYAHLLSWGANRSVISCAGAKPGREILLNTSDIFFKFPQSALFLDLTDCNIEHESLGGKLTGLSVALTPLGYTGTSDKKAGVKKGSKGAKSTDKGKAGAKATDSAGSAAKDEYFIAPLTLMFAVDNSEYCLCDAVFLSDPESTVEDMLISALETDEEALDLMKKSGGELPETVRVKDADGEEHLLLCPEGFYEVLVKCFELITLVTVRQRSLADENDNVLQPGNTEYSSLLQGQPLSKLSGLNLPVRRLHLKEE